MADLPSYIKCLVILNKTDGMIVFETRFARASKKRAKSAVS